MIKFQWYFKEKQIWFIKPEVSGTLTLVPFNAFDESMELSKLCKLYLWVARIEPLYRKKPGLLPYELYESYKLMNYFGEC